MQRDLGSFDLTYKVTGMFFDRPMVQRRLDVAKKRALSKAGAWVRRRAKSLLRRRKRTSNAGEPPSVHSDPGLKTILFVWDPGRQSVVVGPVRLNQVVHGGAGQLRVTTLMEFGGDVTMHEEARKDGRPWSDEIGMWRRRDLRRSPKPWKVYRTRRAKYAPRPFMGPALRDTLPTLPQSCKDMMSPTVSVAAA